MIHHITVYPLVALVAALNFPLGYFRYAQDRHSFGWYFYLCLSSPICVYLKIKAGMDWNHSMAMLCGLFLGQLLGVLAGHRHARGQGTPVPEGAAPARNVYY